MALELPDYVVVAFNLIGLPWPGIDEDELRAWAGGVRRFADDVCDHSSQVNQTMRELADSSESSVIDAVAGEWERHHQLLTELHGPIYDFADALNVAADAVYAQKLVIIGAAAALAAEFTATQVGAIFTLGADEAAVPAEIISTRAIVKFALEELAGVIIGKLINFAAQEISDHLNRTISSMLNGALRVGMEVQSLKLTPKAVSDVSKKLTGQATEVEDTGSKANAENTSRGIEDQTGGGGWSEVINALKQMLFEIAGGLFRNLPGTISRVLGDIAEFLLRFAERVKAADDDGDVAVPSGGARTSAPGIGATPGSEPVPLGSGGKEPDPVGADGTPNAHNSPHECQGEGDPVDVATGGVMLTETDATLPGILPLVLERAHRSTMRPGRWFGRSWMSSLDQRLLVTDGQIRGAFADGRVLTWTSPASPEGFPVIPEVGPMWALRHEEDDAYTVNDPQRGLTWRFERRAGYEDELPLVSVTDRIGHEIAFNYDAAGRPLSVVHSGGYRVLVSVMDEHVTGLTLAGRDGEDDVPLRRFEYDTDGNLSDVVNPSGLPMHFTYDGAGRLTSWTDRNGYFYRYTFDSEGRCIRGDGPDGVLSGTFDYEPGITRWTSIDGAVTTYEITGSAQVAAITDPLGNTARREYDERGRVTARIDPIGRVMRYAYDNRGNLVSVTNPDGHESHAEADEACLPVRITGPDGSVWLQAFDENGNLTKLTAPDGSVIRRGYDNRGHLAEVTSADGAITTVECDATGMPVTVTQPVGEATHYQRDQLGRVVRVTNPDGGITVYTWTTDGLPVSRTPPDGSTESWVWDGEGNLKRRISAAGSVTSYDYGQFDQLVAITWPGGTHSEFEYDHSRNLTSVTHGRLKWQYEYNSAGRLTAQTDYNGATTQYWHNPAGQLIRRVTATGYETTCEYDPLGNLVSQIASDGSVTTFGYDAAGRLVRAKNDDANVIIVRDALGRVITESCNGRAVTTTYDAAGKVTGRITPSGADTSWSYNAAGMPSALTADGRELRFGYDPAGRETRRDLPGGTVLTQEWDHLDRLVTQALTRPTASSNAEGPMALEQLLQRRAYAYNPDGFVTGLEDLLTGGRAFRLDPAGRVTAVTSRGDDWSERYDYDSAGNIANAVWPALPTGPASNSLEMSPQGSREIAGTLTTRAGNIRYRYDAAGRVITRTRIRISRKPDIWHYKWDADNRLISVTLPDGSEWRYQYDPLGRRIGKQHVSADGQLLEQTQFSWDGGILAEQEDLHADSEQVTTWNYRPDSFIPLTQTSRAVLRGNPAQEKIDEEFYSIITDLTGTPTELVSPDGSIADNQQHTLWGHANWQNDAAATPLRFPGQYHDQETGLHYNNYRYYDPDTGTYLSPDPLGLTPAPNPHAYVPNPYAASDPLGLLTCEEAAAAVRDKVSQMESAMTKGNKGFGSTYSAAWVRTADGNEEMWVAAAGKEGYTRPAFRGDARNVQFPKPPDIADNYPHINDAEMHIYRTAQKEGATIMAIGATRPACAWCQERLPDSIPIVTGRRARRPGDVDPNKLWP